MPLVNALFSSHIGIMAFITIFMIGVIATFLFFWIKKQADKERHLS